GLEAADEPALDGVAGALVEVVGAEVGVDLAGGEQVVGDDQDAVADGDGGPLGAPPRRQPPVLGAQVGLRGAAGALGRLGQRGPQPGVGPAGAPALALAGALVGAGAQPGPGGQVGGGGEASHIRSQTLPLLSARRAGRMRSWWSTRATGCSGSRS